MKTTQLTFILFVLISLFTYSSCSKESNDIPTTIEESTMTAKINGQNFRSKIAVATIDADAVASSAITGSEDEVISEDGSWLSVAVFHDPETPLEEGTYDSSDSECFFNASDLEVCAIIFYRPDSNSNEEVVYGSLGEGGVSNFTISSIDYRIGGHITGIFSGTLIYEGDDENRTTITITDGKFNAAIQ